MFPAEPQYTTDAKDVYRPVNTAATRRPDFVRPINLVILILMLGAGLRLADLRVIPPGDWYDEAINGLDALRILEKPGWPLFFETEGHPREPLYMYCMAAVFEAVGANVATLRATSALIGILTIFVVWLWVREIADERRALLTALALALMRWHIHFSRLGFRTILTPLFIALVLWAVWRAARMGKEGRGKATVGWAAAAGFFFGVGFSTYLSFRVVPVLLGAVAVHAWWVWRKHRPEGEAGAGTAGGAAPVNVEDNPADRSGLHARGDPPKRSDLSDPSDSSDAVDRSNSTDLSDPTYRPDPEASGDTVRLAGSPGPAPPDDRSARSSRRRWGLWGAAFVLAFAIGLLPTAIDAVRNPDHLFKRADEVSPFSKGLGPGLRLVANQARDVALMFFVRGDHVAKHNIPGGIQWLQLYGWRSPGADEAIEWQDADRAARAMGVPPPDPHGHGLPVFDPLAALFFAIGLVVLLGRARRDTAAFSVLAWIVLIALTSVLSYGAPNYLRTLGMVPAVAFTLVEGLDWSRRRVERRWGRGVAVGLLIFFFLYFGAIEGKRYFHDWPDNPMTWRGFNTEFADLAHYVRRTPTDMAFQVPDYLRNTPTFEFGTHGRKGIFGFGAAASEAAGEFNGVLVVAPLPPYPPAPVSVDWIRNRQMAGMLRRPDGQTWAILVYGPAPAK